MKHIVLVDDDPAILDAVRLIFDPTNYQMDVYQSGAELIKGPRPEADLYILDRQLSGVDGLDLCRFLKAAEGAHAAPVLIISASPNIEIVARAAGADAVLEKPFSVKEFRSLINDILDMN